MTEFASALATGRRNGQLDAGQSKAAWRNFENQCAGEIRLLSIDREAYRIATATVRRARNGLRAADALHLAVARQAGIEEVATLDHAMQQAAGALRMRVTPPS